MTLQPCIHQHAYVANKDIFLFNHIIITHNKISNESLLLLFHHPVIYNSLQPMDCSMPGLPVPHHLPEFAQVHVPLHWWCHPTISSSDTSFSFCPQSFPASEMSNESSVCIRWPKYQIFTFSISPSSEYSGLISLKIDWFVPVLAAQGTLRSFLQHHSLKASVL